MSAIGTLEKIEIAEVLNEMVKRACLFEKLKITSPTATTITSATTSATTTTTTAYRNTKSETTAAKDVDRVLAEPVIAEAAYPNLVSNNKMNSQK